MKTSADIVKSARWRSTTTAVIYWEVEKGAYRVRVRLRSPLEKLPPGLSLRLSPFLLILNVKTRHPTGDIFAPKILFEVARRGYLSVARAIPSEIVADQAGAREVGLQRR